MDFIEKLSKVKEKYDRIIVQLSDPENLNNTEKLISLSKERSDLTPLIDCYLKYEKITQSIEGNKELIGLASDDKELADLAQSEMAELQNDLINLEEELKVLLLPKDPNDDKDVIMEIRAGTGGDEAALFAANLYRMYTRYAELIGWKTEIIDLNDTGLGGMKEVVFSMSGKNVYGDLKFESGVHRVQRVPETEAGGRVHT